MTVFLVTSTGSCDKFIKVIHTCSSSTLSFKWTVGNVTSWGFWILIILSISTLNIHGVVAPHLPMCLNGKVTLEWIDYVHY